MKPVRIWLRSAVIILAALLGSSGQVVAEEIRYAIVVGNGDYSIGKLPNPVNDARLIAEVLRELHFDVTLVEDADLATFKGSIEMSLPIGPCTTMLG